jgi:geranylgeranyl pyrophosphate synthase
MELALTSNASSDPIEIDPESLRRWADARRDAVIRGVEELLVELAVDEQQTRLFLRTLPDLERRARVGVLAPAIHLPLLCFAAAGGSEADAIPLAVATAIAELAMDVFDHEMDGETSAQWQGESSSIIQAAATTLLVGAFPLAIARAAARPEQAATMQRIAAQRMLRISAGQVLDLCLFNRTQLTLDEANAAAVGKTGERRALYSVLGALLADAPSAAVDAYDEMGRHYGVSRQIASDLTDLIVSPHSRDLASGARTWPIVWMMNRLSGEPRAQFVEQLSHARNDPEAARSIRELMIESGVEMRGLMEVERWRRRARAALDRAQPRGPAATVLRRAALAPIFVGELKHARATQTSPCS